MMKLLAVCFAFACLACSSSPVPKGILPPQKMKQVVFDMLRADEFVNNYVLRDSTLKSKEQHIKMYEQVFLIHQTNRQAFYNSLKYYQQCPKLNRALNDSLLTFATRKKDTLIKVTDTVSTKTPKP